MDTGPPPSTKYGPQWRPSIRCLISTVACRGVRLLLRHPHAPAIDLLPVNDRKKLNRIRLPLIKRLIAGAALHKARGTYVEELLKDAELI